MSGSSVVPERQLGLRERPRRQAQGHGRRERGDAGDDRQLARRRDGQGLQVEREPRSAGRAVQLHRQRPDRDRDRRQERGERGLLDRARDPARHEAQGPGERPGRTRRSRARPSTAPPSPTRPASSRSPRRPARTSSRSRTSPSGRRRPATSRSARTPATTTSPTRRRRSSSRSPTRPTSRSR